jgi:hypothetical protein
MGGLNISGSVVAAPSVPSEWVEQRVKWHEHNRVLSMVGPWFEGWKDRYFAGELDPKDMKPEGYLTSRLLLLMRGANADLWASSRKWDPAVIEEVGMRLSANASALGLLVTKITRGDFVFYHLDKRGNREHGGVNLLFLADNDTWQGQNNWRRWQQFGTVREEEGKVVVETLGMTNRKEPLAFGVTPETGGEKWQLLARGIRSLVMSASNNGMAEPDSASWQRVVSTEVRPVWSLQQCLEVTANLFVAYGQSPSETKELMRMIGWPEEKLARLPGEQVNLSQWLSKESLAMSDPGWVKILAQAEGELLGYPGKMRLVDLAPVMELFGMVHSREALALVPEPDMRERVERV